VKINRVVYVKDNPENLIHTINATQNLISEKQPQGIPESTKKLQLYLQQFTYRPQQGYGNRNLY
jgi:hypothetical protein